MMQGRADILVTMAERIYKLQLVQLEHDEKYHKDVVIMPLAERVKHMALHNAKYTGYLVEALDKEDGDRFQSVLTDAFVITLATANTLNQDLGKESGRLAAETESLAALGISFASEFARDADDPFGFVKAYAREAGRLAKVCESWDHMENMPFRDLMCKSNLALFKQVVAEVAIRQLDLEALYRTRLRAIESRSIFDQTLSTARLEPR